MMKDCGGEGVEDYGSSGVRRGPGGGWVGEEGHTGILLPHGNDVWSAWSGRQLAGACNGRTTVALDIKFAYRNMYIIIEMLMNPLYYNM